VTKAWVYGLLGLLCIPGVIGFDAWPLTGWRLFSLSRDGSQTEWALDAVTPDGDVPVELEQLPLAFRNAEWILADLPKASDRRREEVCTAMTAVVHDLVPETTALVILRERQRMVDSERVVGEREVIVRCGMRFEL
jgi:hypothetical protein